MGVLISLVITQGNGLIKAEKLMPANRLRTHYGIISKYIISNTHTHT